MFSQRKRFNHLQSASCMYMYAMYMHTLHVYIVACIINSLQLSNDASRILTDNSRVLFLIVALLIDNYRGVIYNPGGIIYTHLFMRFMIVKCL
jgi:hypothetical protein